MKKIIISIVVVIVVVGIGYFFLAGNMLSGEYKQVFSSEVNATDRVFANVEKQVNEDYQKGDAHYGVSVGILKDKATASTEMSRLIATYNPTDMNVGGKLIKYSILGGNVGNYFYQSGNKIIMVTSSHSVDDVTAFLVWLSNKYQPL